MRASVIIPTHDRPAYLREAVRSVCRSGSAVRGCEVIVVDNGAGDEARRMMSEIAGEGCEVRYVRERATGLHHARHAGAGEARGEVLAYVDDDVIVPSGWLEAILEPFEDSGVAVVGGKVVPKWEAEPPPWLAQFDGGQGRLSLLDLGDETMDLPDCRGVYGCNMAVRRSALYEVGGFNPDAYGERRLIWLRGDGEIGLQNKLREAGYRLVYAPRAWLYHRVPAGRLRPGYFYWRAFIEGIADSYTYARSSGLPAGSAPRHVVHCLRRALRWHLDSLRGPDSRIFRRDRACYWLGRALHQMRLAVSPSLRRHVLQETYLSRRGKARTRSELP